MKENHYNRKNFIHILLGGLMLFCILCPKMIAFAGGINGNEARVIAAASGTFQYNGKTYRAGSAYINSLASYLSNDDVDLTAAQADEAIAMMYGSVAEGVAQGYLYEVGGTTEATTEELEIEEETDTDKEEMTTEELTSEEAITEEDDAETEGQDDEYDVWDMMSNETVTKDKLENRPEKEDAEVAVELDEDQIVIVSDENEISISKEDGMIPDSFILAVNIGAVVISIITILCGVVLVVKKCMSFKKPRSRKARPGHSKRRKIRRHTRNILTVLATINITGVLLLAGGYASLFNKDVTMRNMQNSGYFRYAYSQYVASEEGETEGYEEYLFKVKQSSMQILEGSEVETVPDSNVTPYIYSLKLKYLDILEVGGVITMITLLVQMILMVFMDQRRERGVKHIAVADLIASALVMVVTLVLLIGQPYKLLYIEPDYLYLFLMECITWSIKVMFSITAFGVVVGMILVGVYNTMKRNRNE